MKHKDVVFVVLSEISGKSVDTIRQVFSSHLNTPLMEEELTDEDARIFLEELRKEKQGILNWMSKGLIFLERKERPGPI